MRMGGAEEGEGARAVATEKGEGGGGTEEWGGNGGGGKGGVGGRERVREGAGEGNWWRNEGG